MSLLQVTRRSVVACVFLVLTAFNAQAAYYDVAGDELVGAFGVDVDGTLYDVRFGDGRCVDLYSGCDELSDLPFGDPEASQVAANALLTQVFGNGDKYDADPTLTRGCETTVCFIMMPYLFSSNPDYPGWVQVKGGRNTTSLADNTVGFSLINPTADISAYPSWTFAQWELSAAQINKSSAISVVPVPAAFWLFASAIAFSVGLGLQRKSGQPEFRS